MIDDRVVRSAFEHAGTARVLVHRLKYEGSRPAANALAASMALRLDRAPAALVPVPRALFRRWRYAVDPAAALARGLAALTGAPVVRALSTPVATAVHAGADRSRRTGHAFGLVILPPPGSIIVDDVVTTGRTIRAAAAAIGPTAESALTATSAPEVTSLLGTNRGGSRT